MNPRNATVVALVLTLVVGLVAPAATTATAASEDLSVGVAQDETGEATVTVTRNDTAVENATVTVESVDPYAGNGTYETDANGTVTLPAPDENRTVEVTATAGNLTARTAVDLEAALDVTVEQADDGTATVTVIRNNVTVENATVEVATVGNASYAGTGTYETDTNGTVSLPAPEEEVEVTVTATEGNDTAETTITLYTAQKSGAFGQAVSDFVHSLLGSGERGIGHEVSTFATANNPSNGQGPPDHAGPPDSDDEDGEDEEDDASAEDEEEEEEDEEEEDETDEDATATEDDEEDGETGDDGKKEENDDEDDDDDASNNGNGNDGNNGNGPPDHAGR